MEADHRCADDCGSYRPGHRMHFIQTKFVNRSPGGWRDGTVREVDGLSLLVVYADDPGRIRVWHHRPVLVGEGSGLGLEVGH